MTGKDASARPSSDDLAEAAFPFPGCLDELFMPAVTIDPASAPATIAFPDLSEGTVWLLPAFFCSAPNAGELFSWPSPLVCVAAPGDGFVEGFCIADAPAFGSRALG